MAEPMSEAMLAEIEARTESATPGPWVVSGMTVDEAYGYQIDAPGRVICGWSGSDPGIGAARAADAAFIASTRQDVPDLVAEVRRLRELARLAGVSDGTVRRLVEAGTIHRNGAGWSELT